MRLKAGAGGGNIQIEYGCSTEPRKKTSNKKKDVFSKAGRRVRAGCGNCKQESRMEECSLILSVRNTLRSPARREGEGRGVGVWEGGVELESALGGRAGDGDWAPVKTLSVRPPGCGAD